MCMCATTKGQIRVVLWAHTSLSWKKGQVPCDTLRGQHWDRYIKKILYIYTYTCVCGCYGFISVHMLFAVISEKKSSLESSSATLRASFAWIGLPYPFRNILRHRSFYFIWSFVKRAIVAVLYRSNWPSLLASARAKGRSFLIDIAGDLTLTISFWPTF